jgi:hypothetical protein
LIICHTVHIVDRGKVINYIKIFYHRHMLTFLLLPVIEIEIIIEDIQLIISKLKLLCQIYSIALDTVRAGNPICINR